MFEIRDHDARECAAGRGSLALFLDVCALNNFMKDEDANVALFRQLHETDSALATECFPSMEDMLVKHREYSLCLGCLPAAQAAFAGIRHHWEQDRQVEAIVAAERRATQRLLDEMREEYPEWKTLPKHLRPVHPTADKTFIIQTRQLIEILVGAGKISEAEKIRDLSSALLPNDGLESAVSDAQKNVGKDS